MKKKKCIRKYLILPGIYDVFFMKTKIINFNKKEENMKKYILYGLTIETDVNFIQLIKADDTSETDIIIKQENCQEEVTDYLTKAGAFEKRYEIGLNYSCFYNKGGYYVIREGKEIVYKPNVGYSPEALGSWLLGFAMAMLLLQRKTLAVHCGAVCSKGDGSDKDVVLITGHSGAGKSSLTRRLIEDGYKLMADDVAAVRCEDTVTVYSAFPYQKLCRNEVDKRGLNYDRLIYINEDKDKFLVPVENDFSVVPGKIKFMVYVMEADVKEVQIRKLSGLEQLMAIRENLFLNALKGDWLISKDVLNLCLKMAENCPVYVLARPRNVDSLATMAEMIRGIK